MSTGDDSLSIPSLRLKELCTPGGRGVLSYEFKKDPALQAHFDIRAKYLSKFPRDQWNKKQFRHIRKQVYEIKWTSGKKEWRALGFFNAEGFFVVVRLCNHKGKVYDPPDCFDRTIELKKEVESGSRTVKSYDP